MVPSTFRTIVKELHQIELTSRCSLKCGYCPSAKMQAKVPGFRDTIDMAEDDFVACLGILKVFCDRGTQQEVNLAGIGESTLLGDLFIERLRRVRETVGPDRRIVISTNGLHLNDEFAAKMAQHGLEVQVSLHVGLKRAHAGIVALQRAGIYQGVGYAPAEASVSWAGQVDWIDNAPNFGCDWLVKGKTMALADGRLAACSLDATGETTVGTLKELRDALESGRNILTGTSELCRKCHHRIGGWDQSKAEKAGKDSPVYSFNVVQE